MPQEPGHAWLLPFVAEGMRVLKSTQGLLAMLRWTRNPLGSARKGSNPLGVPLLARYVAGVWLPLPWPLLTRLKSIEVITGARGASHVVPRIPVEERRP